MSWVRLLIHVERGGFGCLRATAPADDDEATKAAEVSAVLAKFGVLRMSHEHAARVLGQRR